MPETADIFRYVDNVDAQCDSAREGSRVERRERNKCRRKMSQKEGCDRRIRVFVDHWTQSLMLGFACFDLILILR